MTVQLCEHLVWVLVHSLWQGILIAGFVSVPLRWLPARRAEARYATGLAGLGMIVLSVLVTWSVLTLETTGLAARDVVPTVETTPYSPQTAVDTVTHTGMDSNSQAASSSVTPTGVSRSTVGPTFTSRDWMPWVAALWLIGASVMLIRSMAAIVQVRQWRTPVTEIPVLGLDRLNALKQELCERLYLKRLVSMVVSDRVNVPSVIGTLWPCILIPPALLTGIPLDQWRVILAHELAHIRRYDVLVNLVQMMIESLLFFNPAVWWLSHQIRVEREACCDALAARVCGQPLSVARTLVEFAAGLQGDARWPATTNERENATPAAASSTAVMAFANPAEPGELTDRVQRLVEPDTAARPRISWPGLCVVLCSLILTAAALHWGTSLAVRTAAQLMSPQERVARLERLQTEATGVFLPAEPKTHPGPAGVTSDATKTSADDMGKIAVLVVVRTADGSPIPKGMLLESLSQTGNSTNGSTLDHTNQVMNQVMPEYRKVFHYDPCKLRIGALAPGFAFVVSPTLSLFPDEKTRTVELVLTKGWTATLKLHDPRNQPIAGAMVKVMSTLSIEGGGGMLNFGSQELTSDEAGIVKIEHVGGGSYHLTVRAPRFERYETRLEFTEGKTVEKQMKAAVPVSYQVTDGTSGQPIAEARFVIASIQRGNGRSAYGSPRRTPSTDQWNNYAESDADGRVVLDELQDGARYTFAVLAAGYGMAVVEDVHPGQPPGVVKLVPPLKLAGRVEGALDQLVVTRRKGMDKPQRTLAYSTRISNMIHDSNSVIVADDGQFEIGDLIENEQVSIRVVNHNVDFVMSKSLTDVVLKIGAVPEPQPFPKREVIIRLTGTAPGAPARGNLYVNWRHANPACRDSHSGPLPLRSNELRMSVPIGAQLDFRPQHLVGYRIENRDQIEILAGSGPQVIEVPTQPAGGIHGTITRADGTPATGAFVTAFAMKLPTGEKHRSKINPDSASASSTFLATLPLGGRYRILARETNDMHNVWTVSDEIAIDEGQPIAEVHLKLPPGRTIPIKVIDPDGKPVVDQEVVLNLSFSYPKGHSIGTSINRITGPDGIAKFEDLSVDSPIAPLECMLSMQVSNSKYIGWQQVIDPRGPLEIRLERGLTRTGVLIETASGKSIPNAHVRLVPSNFATAKYKGSIRTTTDKDGQFRFEGLEPMEYVGYVEETAPKGAILTPQPDGGLRIAYPSGVDQHRLSATSQTPVRWEVIIYPTSKLKAAE